MKGWPFKNSSVLALDFVRRRKTIGDFGPPPWDATISAARIMGWFVVCVNVNKSLKLVPKWLFTKKTLTARLGGHHHGS